MGGVAGCCWLLWLAVALLAATSLLLLLVLHVEQLLLAFPVSNSRIPAPRRGGVLRVR